LAAEQDPLALFSPVSMVPEGYVGGSSDTCARIVRGFLHHWFTEIRTIICEQEQLGAAAKTADLSNKTVATALAVWLTGIFGITSPVAIGLATLILLVLGQATKDAFCQMTQAQVVNGISLETRK